jgi:hypothetical protein
MASMYRRTAQRQGAGTGRRCPDQSILRIGKSQAIHSSTKRIHDLDINSRLPAAMSDAGIEQRFASIHDLWSALLGVVVGCLCAYALVTLLRGFEPSVYAWLIAAALAGAMIALVFVSDWHIRAGAIAALLAYGLSLVYLLSDPRTAIERAKAIAGDRPYCIQVAQGVLGVTGYRPAASKLDLTGMTMRAAGFQFHAVMAVGEGGDFDLHNWSYRQRDWMPLTIREHAQPVISCRTQNGFVEALPLLKLTGSSAIRQFGNRSLLVPDRYRPRFQPDSTMTFIARAPAFGSVSYCPELRLCLFDMITVSFLPGSGMVWFPQNELTRFQDGSVESGTATHVECASLDPNARCSHTFISDGLLFSFNYPQHQLPQWREMQGSVLALYRSFEIDPKR